MLTTVWRMIAGTFLVLSAAAASAAGMDERTDLWNQLRELELRLEEMKKVVPLAEDDSLVEAERYVKRRAKAAGLTAVNVKSVAKSQSVPLPDGKPSPFELVRIEISGRDEYAKVHLFLEFVAKDRPTRLVDFESVHLAADAGGKVRFSAPIVLAYWRFPPPDAPAPSGRFDVVADTRERLRKTRAQYETLTTLAERLAPARFVNALAALHREADDQAIALTEMRMAPETTIRGVAMGVSARAAVKRALESSFGEIRMQVSPFGECHAFTATGRLEASDPALEGYSGAGRFDERTSAICKPGPSPAARQVVARGTTAGTADSAINLHLRDMDAADVFRILNSLTSDDFVVESDVKDRLRVDIDNATLQETLAAIESVGLEVQTGPLHRVCRKPCRPVTMRSETYTGEGVTFTIKDADVQDVFCLFEEISSLKVLVPQNVTGQFSMFFDDVPWDRVFATTISLAGLSYKIDQDRVLLAQTSSDESKTSVAAARACESRRSSSRESWSRIKPERVGVSDLKLVGLSHAMGVWKGYAYEPSSRVLQTLEAGGELFDGLVSAVNATGVTFQTAGGGTVTVPLRP